MGENPFALKVLPMSSAVSAKKAPDDWQAFIQSHAYQLPGYERSLAQTIESIHLCAAIKQAKAEELVLAFKNHKT